MPAPPRAAIIAAMDHALFTPWMLRADWRDDDRPWLLVDLAQWPPDVALAPLPPVPVIGIGPADHPQAHCLDALIEPGFTIEQVAAQIERTPLAAAALVQLLRATHDIAPEAALMAESFAFAMLQGGGEHRHWLAAQTPEPATAPGDIHVTRTDDRLDIVIDRPHALGAIDRPMRDALFDAFTLATLDESVTHLHLRSVGRAFSMGADLAEFGTTRDPVAAHMIRARTLPAWPLLRRKAQFDVRIQGACVGSGLELAAFADRITATPGAWFQLPETGMGIMPGFGGSVSIPRRIGRQRAALLMLSGKRISAQTALGWGLVDDLASDQRGGDQIS